MNINVFAEGSSSDVTPLDQLHSKEFIEGVLKAGSYISIIENKKINITAFFSLILENKSYQDFFTEVTDSDSFREAISNLLYIYPSLIKSKITKSTIRKLNTNATTDYGTGKIAIQQTPSGIKKSKKKTV
jgi:hypothetical protein